MGPSKKEIQTKLMRGLLDFVILQLLKDQPMHGYQVISSLRKNFGVYFGPSTIYPLLSLLEEKEYVKSHWDLKTGRPRKVYSLTSQPHFSRQGYAQPHWDITESNLQKTGKRIR